MTTAELNALKNRLLSRNINSLDALTRQAELILANAIIEEAAKLDYDEEGRLVGSGANIASISKAIENAFKQYRSGPQIDIIKNILRSYTSIGSLNQSYFNAAIDDKKQYDAIIQDVEKEMRRRVGIDSSGNLLRGGFLFNLVNDTGVAAKIHQQAQQGIVSNMSVSDYLKTLRVNIVGAKDLPGPFTQHYRTFVHDSYMAYDATYGNEVAIELGLDDFIYAGGLIETSRRFCRERDGKTFTRKDTESWINDPFLPKTKAEVQSGVINYNPIQDRGRWYCRHHINWILPPKK